MSLKAMTWVWDNSPYELGARLVHLALADVANDAHNNELWMVQESIATKSGLSVRQVRRHLTRMVEEGYLELLEQGGGRGHPCRYRLIIKPGQNVIVSANDDYKPGQNVIVSDDKPGQDVRFYDATPSYKNSSINTVHPTIITPSKDLTGFDYFWQAYPMRNGRRLGKKRCVDLWVKLDLDTRRAAYRGAVNYAKECNAKRNIAKDPERWLRDQCWEDWQVAVVAETTTESELRISEDYYL